MDEINQLLKLQRCPKLPGGTLLLALTGWMDGGEVSTGTVSRLVHLLDAPSIGEIDPEPFFIFNFPGSMEVAALFRPPVEIEDGLLKSIEMPTNLFYAHEAANLMLFVGREPNLRWRTYGECIFEVARRAELSHILFIGSFGGAIPHTRAPRLYVSCSDEELLKEMEQYAVRRSGYAGPGSFTNFLMANAASRGLKMASLVAEVPGYLQGTNPVSIEAVTRRLAKLLRLPLNLDELRAASTEWELQVTGAIEQDKEMAEKVRAMEEAYDNDLLELDADQEAAEE